MVPNRTAPPRGRAAKALPPDSLLERLEPTSRRCFALAGETLAFETNDDRIMELAAELFSRYGPPKDITREPLLVRVLVHEPSAAVAASPSTTFRTFGHLFTVVLGPHDSAAADVVAGRAFAIVRPSLVDDGRRLQQQLIAALALGMLGPARGYLPLHCACVTRAGRSVLLHGPSGAGKSTLAYAAARRGFQIVSEDSLQIGGPGEARAWGVPWQFQLLPDTVRFFPELEGIEPRPQPNGERKLDVDLDRLLPGSVAASAPVGPLLVLTRRPGRTVIERLPDAEAAELIEPVWPWQVGWTDGHDALLANVRRRGVYRFASDAGPDAMVDALDDFLARAAD